MSNGPKRVGTGKGRDMAMELTEVLKSLERNTGVFPRKAVEAAMEMRDEITPRLLHILEDTVERAEEIVREDEDGAYFAHLYSMYLLAQFRETRAYPLVVRFARIEKDLLEALAGEFVTEDLSRVLASVCSGDTRLIEELIEDPDVDEYVRSAALRSLLVLVAESGKSRDEVMAYFKSLFEGRLERSYSHAWNSLVACAVRLHPGEVSDHITMAFEEGLVDPGFISPRNVENALKTDKESVLADLPLIEGGCIGNVVDELASWACFKQPKRPARVGKSAVDLSRVPAFPERSQPKHTAKVKPNEPCPCGSGKKYKKCCGRIDAAPPQPKRFVDPRIYEVRVSLEWIDPEIWRRFRVPGDITLAKLHYVLQNVMGWHGGDYHAHVFWTPNGKYGVPSGPYTDMIDETKVTLGEMIHNDGREFMYVYDYGDQWRHVLTVENILDGEPGADYPVCIAGARACPPEDCGGVGGYQRLIDMLSHPDDFSKDYVDWVGVYDPERFDAEFINRRW
jgi:hypothetical protein